MNLLQKYFPEITSIQLEQLLLLENLLMQWNAKINLVSRNDSAFILERHILHSLSIVKIISFRESTKIMDVGTGGGFPGIPLAIMFPDSEFSLVDSIGKKIMVVNDLVEKLELKNVKTFNARAESLDEKFHFITSRAVTAFPEFYQLVKNKISRNHFNQLKNGIIYLKGGDFSDEVNSFGKRLKVFEISNLFIEEYFESKKIIYLSF